MSEQPQGESRIPCSAGVLTYNSAATLEKALQSVERFAEIVVSDGGSTDATLEIAAEHGARIIRQDPALKNPDGRIADFAGAMNQMIDEAGQPWFYKLDSDEYLSASLVEELAHVLPPGDDIDAFKVPFKYVLDGVVIEQATTYPASEPRLFRLGSGLRYERPVHERLVIVDERTAILAEAHLKPLPTARIVAKKWWHYLIIELRIARGIGLEEWRATNLRRHRWSAKHLTKQFVRIVRSSEGPRLPARYEILRIANDLVAIPVTGLAAIWRARTSANDGDAA